MKYEFIDTYRSTYKVIRMCKALKVYESGFYRWQDRKKSPRELEDEEYVKLIRQIHEENFEVYGPKKIQEEMEKKGCSIGIYRLKRLMRENGIYPITRTKYKPYPKTVEEEERYKEDQVKQEFTVEVPNKTWCGDITYIKTRSGWVYLAAVLDLFNREIVGYSLSRKANTELTKRAMANALVNRRPGEGLIFHSDRGCQVRREVA